MRLSAKIKLLTLIMGSLITIGCFSIISLMATSSRITNNFTELEKFSSENAFYRMEILQLASTISNHLQITFRQSDPDVIEKYLAQMQTEEQKILETIKKCEQLCERLNTPIAKIIEYRKNAIDAFLVGDTAKALEITLNDVTKLYDQLYTLLDEIEAEVKITLDKAHVKIENETRNSLIITIVIVLIGVVFTALLSFFVVNKLISTIQQLIIELTNTMHAVKENSDQISQASSTISESSANQASSVEETASSLEEFSQMLASNVNRSENSQNLSHQMDTSIQNAADLMKQLTNSMSQIMNSNKKIDQLVTMIGDINTKTSVVDEIVFQTKLLSFNASVEAERAGEHGRGFAVVAQEVGNLAALSGKAASEIAQIVGASIKEADRIAKDNYEKVKQGNENVSTSAVQIEDIANKSKSLLNDVEEILKASSEQSLGIKQINQAISSIEQSTSKNSEVASETETIAKKLNEETKNLETILGKLNLVVLGK